jgi:hypothetical protein
LSEERTIRIKVENETVLIWALIFLVLLLVLAILIIWCCCRKPKQVTTLAIAPVKPGLPEMPTVKRPSPKKRGKFRLPGPPLKPKPLRPPHEAPDSLTDWSSLSQDEPDPDVAPSPPIHIPVPVPKVIVPVPVIIGREIPVKPVIH